QVSEGPLAGLVEPGEGDPPGGGLRLAGAARLRRPEGGEDGGCEEGAGAAGYGKEGSEEDRREVAREEGGEEGHAPAVGRHRAGAAAGDRGPLRAGQETGGEEVRQRAVLSAPFQESSEQPAPARRRRERGGRGFR